MSVGCFVAQRIGHLGQVANQIVSVLIERRTRAWIGQRLRKVLLDLHFPHPFAFSHNRSLDLTRMPVLVE